MSNPTLSEVPIIRHPDVRRNLMTMRCLTEATRALGCYVAAKQDFAVLLSSKQNHEPLVAAAAASAETVAFTPRCASASGSRASAARSFRGEVGSNSSLCRPYAV